MFVPRERSKIISDQILNAPGDASHRGRAEGSTTEPDEAVYRVSTLDVKWDQRHKKILCWQQTCQWMARFECR
jgi:hypothetical protein